VYKLHGAPVGSCTMQATAAVAFRAKRTHDEDVYDDAMDDTRGDDDGNFQLFQSRYSKRLCRQRQHQQPQPSTTQSATQSRLLQQNKCSGRREDPRGSQRQQQQPRANQTQQSGKSKPTTDRSQLYDDIIESVASSQNQNQSNNNSGDDLTCLKLEIIELQHQVTNLTKQLDYVLSFLGITEKNGQTHSHTITDAVIDPALTSIANTYASATAHNIQGPIRNAVLTAVHSELRLKKSRASNIVVSGLPHNTDLTDVELFIELCVQEFNICPIVVHAKRLGREAEGRSQPLLIVLQEEEQAKLLLSLARSLRDSEDVYTSSNVFFTPHQTRAERQEAYEERCRRRRRQQQEEAHSDDQHQHQRQSPGRNPAGHSSSRGHGTTVAARRPAAVAVQSLPADKHDNRQRTTASRSVPAAVAEMQVVAAVAKVAAQADYTLSADELNIVAKYLESCRSRGPPPPAAAAVDVTPQQAAVGAAGSMTLRVAAAVGEATAALAAGLSSPGVSGQ